MFLKRKFSMELQRTISSIKAFQQIQNYEKFENLSSTYFNSIPNLCNIKKRGFKQCYVYFLIDPRFSRNMPFSAKAKVIIMFCREWFFDVNSKQGLNEHLIWHQFLNSIFYVGKAKSTRPYSHLYKAVKKFNKQVTIVKESVYKAEFLNNIETSIQSHNLNKIDRIVDIWRSGFGVVNLNVFHNITPYEAYTREAAIIDAISLPNLANQKRGAYYGPSSKWTGKGRKSFGIALLYRAMKIFMMEGEAQLFPFDFDEIRNSTIKYI